jgi:hypothetical protein
MYTHSFPMRPVRALAPSRFAAGALVTLALLSAACSDSGSRITRPQLRSGPRNVTSITSNNFTVLDSLGVTCTSSTINGNVSIFEPLGPFVNTSCNVSGTITKGTAADTAAYTSFQTTYTAVGNLPCDFYLTGTLAGVTLTVPGVYCFLAGAAPTGILTLNGPSGGNFIFKIGTTGTGALAATNFTVALLGSTVCSNVTWWVKQAATITYTVPGTFIGTILAGTDITMTGPISGGGTFDGNAWSHGYTTISYMTLNGCTDVAVAGGGAGGASGGGGPTLLGTEHFTCYVTTDQTKNVGIPITLVDQFSGSVAPTASAALYLCNPVAKTVGAVTGVIVDDTTHLVFYQLTQKPPTINRTVVINNQFGQDTLHVSSPALVAVPTLKNFVGTQASLDTLSHFACYVVANGPSANLRVGLQDQFFTTPQAVVVKTPQWFCNPAVKTHGDYTSHTPANTDHLVCYNVAPSVNPPKTFQSVHVENQFEGFNTWDVFKIGPLQFLCVPSQKVDWWPRT